MARKDQDYRKYLSPNVLGAVKGLELRARLIVEGFLGGMHHSPHHGLSVEFADHRVYSQGDDIRHLDWKVYGKTDKYYVKEYEQETNLSIVLAVDASDSMRFQGDKAGLSKYEYAVSLASAIAFLGLAQHDSVGLVTFDSKIRGLIKPSNNSAQWRAILRELDQPTGSEKTSLGTVMDELAERLSRRTLVILISDLFDEADVVIRGLQRLRFRHHDLIVWNVWDDDELNFSIRGPTLFEGMEDGGHLQADPDSLRSGYLQQVERFLHAIRKECARIQVDYHLMNTSKALDVALATYLATRSGRLRQRSARVMGSG
ncbi:MAG: DUF58 domain-containing protein [Phycisphaerae bacterium]